MMTPDSDIAGLVEAFRSAAIEKGDVAKSTRQDHALHARLATAHDALFGRGAAGVAAFEALLTDESPHVRSWVAAELLVRGRPQARPVLQALSESHGLIAFSARMTLQEHDAGRLRSPCGSTARKHTNAWYVRETPMQLAGLTLILPDKPDLERDAVADAWERSGGATFRLGRFWDPPDLGDRSSLRVYGNDAFCLVLQQKLALHLVSPAYDLILRLPSELVRRRLSTSPLAAASSLSFPAFVKPLVPKLFRAGVYPSAAELLEECRGLAESTDLLISEPVTLTAEVRCFVLDGEVLAASTYEGDTPAADAVDVARNVAASVSELPVFVVNLGHIKGRGWAVIEFNAAWGAGLNGCSAEAVLPAIAAASDPRRASVGEPTEAR
jgi:hypothetical protein